jgi:hypothetical protein
MKRIAVHEIILSVTEWRRLSFPGEPHPCDVGEQLNEIATRRYTRAANKEINALVGDMPLEPSKAEVSRISACQTFGSYGHRYWRTRIRLRFQDLGRCILGEILMNGELRAALVLLPAHRRGIVDDCIFLRFARLLPTDVAESLAGKVKTDGLNARGDTAFVSITHQTRSKPPRLRHYILLAMRAGLRWAEKREAARKAVARRRRAA